MYGVREVSEEREASCVLLAEDVGFLRYVTVSIGKYLRALRSDCFRL